MRNDVIAGIFDRFPYLSVDVRDPDRDDHPQVLYHQHNKVNDASAAQYAQQLERHARIWAAGNGPSSNADLSRALDGLRAMVKAVSATSLIMSHGDDLLVERPGFEVDKKRRSELTGKINKVASAWDQSSVEDRLAVSRMALLGIAPLQLELVNYMDIERVPHILGRMISRLEELTNRIDLERLPEVLRPVPTAQNGFGDGKQGLSAVEVLSDFYDLEKRILSETGLVRTTIPGGTRPRIYVPQEALAIQEQARLAAAEVLQKGADRTDALASFLGLLWKDFADEAFVVLHDNNEINAYSIVGGCIYLYRAAVDNTGDEPVLKNEGVPQFIRTAGPFVQHPWRRSIDKLSFERGTPALKGFRKEVIEGERLPEDKREIEGRTGIFAKAAQKLMARQINYNMSSVLNGRMERISAEEWAPFMCRDQHGAVYNPGHALAGVGEMFRTLLPYGGRFSQFRSWREVDGTHGFHDIQKFLGYRAALDQYLAGGPGS